MFAELLWIELNHYEVTRVMSQRVSDDGRLVLVDGSMYSNSYVFIDLSAPAAFPFTYQLICAAGSRIVVSISVGRVVGSVSLIKQVLPLTKTRSTFTVGFMTV